MEERLEQCVFCEIICGEAESSEVFRDNICMAFLDVSPINNGHTLVCPIRHVSSFIELEPDEIIAIFAAAQRIAKNQIANIPECSGVNLLLSEGEDAGQEVDHAHLHVVPRARNDGFGWHRYGSPQNRQELDAVAAMIRIS